MKELTLRVDFGNYYKDYSELSDYLENINGIDKVSITIDELLIVSVIYDEKQVNDEIIKLEILAFLNLLNIPAIYGFDKHDDENNLVCESLKYTLCCEFCFGNIIYELYDILGIVKVESDFYHKYWKRKDSSNEYTINIYYNSNVISEKDFHQLIDKLSIYS